MNSIHEKTHADKHWAGEYFGPTGAIEISRKQYGDAKAAYEYSAKVFGSSKIPDNVKTSYVSATMRLMSTLFSAIGHCISNIARPALNNKIWYGVQAYRLVRELSELVEHGAKLPNFHEQLSAGERDVMIATLLFLRWLYPTRYYLERAVGLLRKTIYDDKDAPEVSVLFAMARACRLKRSFKDVERYGFRADVQDAIEAKEAESWLGWRDIARLARLIGDKRLRHHAAKMSGSADAKLKAGV